MKNINKLKTTNRIKILLGIILSYSLVSWSTPHIFVANSTQIKESFLVWVRLTPQRVYSYMRYPFGTTERTVTIENAELQMASADDKQELNYTPVLKGVYAAEDPETKERYVKIEKGTTIEVRTIIFPDGREVKVYVPVN